MQSKDPERAHVRIAGQVQGVFFRDSTRQKAEELNLAGWVKNLPDGKVQAVEVVSPGNAELEDEAIAAVTQWEFSPTYLNCEPIEVRMYVSVSFKLDR